MDFALVTIPNGTAHKMPEAEKPPYLPAVIKVVGVGGAGCNAVNRMVEAGLSGVEFIAVNTDAQALLSCHADHRVHIGNTSTRGLGAGADPEMGRVAVEENREEIGALLHGADMVFVTAGMGGGTGSGASPVVAEIAQQMDILTVGVVTRPFAFEGTRRRRAADEGLERIQDKVDALITISNDRLVGVADKNTTIDGAFDLADDVLRAAVQGISDIIKVHGRVNVDFADVKTILKKSGSAIIGIGSGKGEKRAMEAAQAAICSPLLENSFQGARGILFNIRGGPDLTLHEVDEAARVIAGAAHLEANVIYGVVVDDNETDREVTITVVASGFVPTYENEEPAPARTVFTDLEETVDPYQVPAYLRNQAK